MVEGIESPALKVDQHVRAFAGVCNRNRAADAAITTADQRYAILQSS